MWTTSLHNQNCESKLLLGTFRNFQGAFVHTKGCLCFLPAILWNQTSRFHFSQKDMDFGPGQFANQGMTTDTT
jgi:hypothetical protein